MKYGRVIISVTRERAGGKPVFQIKSPVLPDMKRERVGLIVWSHEHSRWAAKFKYPVGEETLTAAAVALKALDCDKEKRP